ncbi:MAG: YcxB family protein [Tepidisphaeraceae bacterium]|jgi:hypothetical protein
MNLTFQYEYEDLRSPVIPLVPPDPNLPQPCPRPRWQLYAAVSGFFGAPMLWMIAAIYAVCTLSLVWLFAFLPLALICIVPYELLRGRGNMAGSPRGFRRNPDLGREQRFQFNESGMLGITPHIEWRVPWTSIYGLLETKRSIWLHLRSGKLVAIPRRAFAGAAQLQQFKELVSRHVPEDKTH